MTLTDHIRAVIRLAEDTLATEDRARRIARAAKAAARAELAVRAAVADARAVNMSWADIGSSLGTSRQAAQQRFKEADE